jgi:Flp pilus assembly protein CpaB
MAQRSKRNGRIIIYLALIIILVVALAYLFVNGRLPATNTTSPSLTTTPVVVQEEMVNIVITTQSISRGTAFSSEVLTTIKYPKKDFVEGTFYTTVDEVVGKLAKVDLDAQVPLTKSLVVESGSISAEEIPAGMVAISIPLANRISSVSYAPQAGDHVNIIAALTFVDLDTEFQSSLPNSFGSVATPSAVNASTSNGDNAQITTYGDGTQGRTTLDPSLNEPLYVYPSESQRPRLVSQTLLQDIIVLGVGDFALPTQATPVIEVTPTVGSNSNTTTTTTATATVRYPDTITVIVSPQDAVTLNYLIYSGAQLTLVLRSSGDSQRVQTEAVTLAYLMEQYDIPLPDKLAYGTDPRVDVNVPVTPLQLDPRYDIP